MAKTLTSAKQLLKNFQIARKKISEIESSGQIMEALANDREWVATTLQLNREQLSKGRDSEGNSLGVYSPKTIPIRQALGLQTVYVDLKFKGEFYASLYLKQKEKLLEIDSNDSDQTKVNKLLDIYGENIFGVSEENKVILRRLAAPILARYFKQKMNEIFK